MSALYRSYYDAYWACERPSPDADPLTGPRMEKFLQACTEKQFILDLGCGNGRTTQLLKQAGKKVVGLDISLRALSAAKAGCAGTVYVQGLCDSLLPFRDETFDAIYCAEVIEHVLDTQALTREAYRVLKPEGILFVTTPYHGLAKNLLIAALAFDSHFDPTGPHIRFFTQKSLCHLLSENGFCVESVVHLGRFWPAWMNLVVYGRKR